MPPVQTVPSEEVDDDVAFQVLNQDNLPITVIGESMFRPLDGDPHKQKPNAIVYPTRRTNNLEENRNRQFTRSNGYINNEKNEYNLRKNVSNSHGNLNHTNSSSKLRVEDFQNPSFFSKFTKTLDAKLRKLQKDEKSPSRSPSRKNDGSKKPFVTVVKKGQFLEPPPEIAQLLGLKTEEKKEGKRLYAYASKPRILNRDGIRNGHISRCEAAARAAVGVIGAIAWLQGQEDQKDVNGNTKKLMDGQPPLPYANIMFDRRVVRGSTYAQHPMQTGEGESAAARAAEARRRAMARRKAQKQKASCARLRLGSPPPVPGRKHERVQTEMYLEAIFNDPPVEDVCTQTDLFLDRPVSPLYVPAKTGADVETQIYPGDLFDFDMEVQPILEVLVGKTIEQALIEVLEEEELAALREQQRRFMEIRAAETCEAQRMAEREKRLQAERDRKLAEYEKGMHDQKEMEERIAAAVLMQGYMADLLPSVLEGLEAEGFLTDNIKKDVDESFLPWLMKEVTHELQEIVASRDVLTDMVRDILETRAEIYRALYRTPRSESDEEEGHRTQDFELEEHLKLKDAMEGQAEETKGEEAIQK